MIILAISVLIEVCIFNLSFFTNMNNREILISDGGVTDENGVYETDTVTVDAKGVNVGIDLSLENVEYAVADVTLTDEGDEYEYSLPSFRAVMNEPLTCITSIHPYGDVHTIRVKISVPEGASATVDRIVINARRPFVFRPLRCLILFALLEILMLIWTVDRRKIVYLEKWDRWQLTASLCMILLMIVFAKSLTVSNELIVSCPWPHHNQYRELAHALQEGHVALTDKSVSEGLLAKDNPYDTIALMAEGIPFNMDYAYYNGNYYVYFGIIPEITMYYPYLRLTGRDLSNYSAMFLLGIVMIAGVVLCVRELLLRFGRDIPYINCLLLTVGVVFFPNHIYMLSRADIYNIPVMAATAFTWMGIGLWLLALNIMEEHGRLAIAALTVGSFCMAMVAGSRPQMLIYSFVVFPLFLPVLTGKEKGRGMKTAVILGIIIPFVITAIPVCVYNYARFDSIFDFGATYSLTSNDMNHRGFNLDRLLRGLYCFLFQMPNFTTDFPYLISSEVHSDYMGRNLVEFCYGGIFTANLLLLANGACFFGVMKKMKKQAVWMWSIMMAGALIIAAFDVNGAGILYRYTCDFAPGLLIAALIMWAVLSDGTSVRIGVNSRLLYLCVVSGLAFSFLVFLGTGDSVNLRDNSISLYEHIRTYLMF